MEKKFYGSQGMTAPTSNAPMFQQTAPMQYTGPVYQQQAQGKFMPSMSHQTSQVLPTAVQSNYPTHQGQTHPAVVHPTKHQVCKNVIKHVVPHVHPSHTTTVNEHVYVHQHHPTHTNSVVNQCSNQHVMCGPIASPACPPRPCGFW